MNKLTCGEYIIINKFLKEVFKDVDPANLSQTNIKGWLELKALEMFDKYRGKR